MLYIYLLVGSLLLWIGSKKRTHALICFTDNLINYGLNDVLGCCLDLNVRGGRRGHLPTGST